jgi:hypothetical protein
VAASRLLPQLALCHVDAGICHWFAQYWVNAAVLEHAVRVQLFRLEQKEERCVALRSAFRHAERGSASEADELLIAEFKQREETDLYAFHEFYLPLQEPVFVDGVFLLLAMRNIVRFAEVQAKALKPFGKDLVIREALAAFLSKHPLVKVFRDVVEHNDEYVLGRGKRRDLILDEDVCPARSATSFGDAPAAIHRATAVCRRSCTRRPSRPARAVAGRHARARHALTRSGPPPAR